MKNSELRIVARICDVAQPEARDASSVPHQPVPCFYFLDTCNLYIAEIFFLLPFHHCLFSLSVFSAAAFRLFSCFKFCAYAEGFFKSRAACFRLKLHSS